MLGKAIVVASLLALGLPGLVSLGPAWAQDAPRPRPRIAYLHNEPVSGVPGKETTLFEIEWPPSATTGRVTHPGDEYSAVIEGALEVDVAGQKPLIVKAGHAYHIASGVVFETKNAVAGRTRTISVLVTDKGQPLTVPVK
jgi:quercetin dioxygenase-like cupin family protein